MGLLEGKRALIFGLANDHSIAWGIAQALHREGPDAFVVRFAIVRPLERVHRQHALRNLVASQLAAHVPAQRLRVELGSSAQLDHARYGLAPLLIGHAHHDGVFHIGVSFQDLLNLLGIALVPFELFIINLVVGIGIILCAFLSILKPEQGVQSGVVVISLGVMSLLSGNGFMIGAFIAIIGGALILTE